MTWLLGSSATRWVATGSSDLAAAVVHFPCRGDALSRNKASGHIDVVVIGDGLAGLLIADRLAAECSVVRIASPLVPGATERSSSVVACGAQDSPSRLVLGLGEERASQYWQWSAHSVDTLFHIAEELGVSYQREGSWRLALEDRELGEWAASMRLLDRWYAGSPRLWRMAEQKDLDVLGEGFLGGVFIAGDGTVSPLELAAALRLRLEDRAPCIEDTAHVLAGSEEDGAKRIQLGSGEVLRAEMVVIAAGWNSLSVDPALSGMLYPVRLQALRTEPLERRAAPQPVLARHRFESWFQETDGSLVFSGCRWAEQPEMGAGISDADDRSVAVLERQREFMERHLPLARAAAVRDYWSGIAAWSCDGLPLVGTLPGNPRISVLAGWGGAGLSLVAAAATAISDGILGRSGDTAPAFLQPRRML